MEQLEEYYLEKMIKLNILDDIMTKRYCGKCGEKDTMLFCCECLRLAKEKEFKAGKDSVTEITTKLFKDADKNEYNRGFKAGRISRTRIKHDHDLKHFYLDCDGCQAEIEEVKDKFIQKAEQDTARKIDKVIDDKIEELNWELIPRAKLNKMSYEKEMSYHRRMDIIKVLEELKSNWGDKK